MIALIPEIRKQIARRFVAVARLLGKTAFDCPAQGRGKFGIEWRRFFGEDSRHHLYGLVAFKRAFAGRHFIEDEAEGELVAAIIDLAAASLHGTHVVDGAYDHAGA